MAKKTKTKKMKKAAAKSAWSNDDLKLLKKQFPNVPTSEVAAQLGLRSRRGKEKSVSHGTSQVEKIHEISRKVIKSLA